MRRLLSWFAAAVLFATRLAAQPTNQTKPLIQTKPIARPLAYKHPIEDKNFYLLAQIEGAPELVKTMRGDATLSRITTARIEALANAVKTCKTEIECYAAALKWTAADSEEVRQSLARLHDSSQAVRTFADRLKAGGMYVRYNGLPGAEFLAKAWDDCVAGMNRAIDVYGLGVAPRYPAIDSPTYDPKVAAGARGVATLAAVLQDDSASLELFFLPALRFALGLMDFNHRDEAGRFEPMEKGENAAAYRKIGTTQWSRYPYSVIVVPGAGNDQPGIRLSGSGKLRVQLAAKRYRDGKAPFILVSGGFVHPAQTPYAEAIEMKRELMEKYAIPESAILVDPHARHTTTNIRNAARIMYRYGMPFEARALITTDAGQSASIEAPSFETRCVREMGIMPLKVLGRVSAFDLEFVPLIESLQADPTDPLDP
jgi:hypothetical protein